MKEVVNDQFYETFKSYTIDSETDATKKAAQEKYNLINGSEGYLEKYVPYHVRHILIKNDVSEEKIKAEMHRKDEEDKAEKKAKAAATAPVETKNVTQTRAAARAKLDIAIDDDDE